MIPVIKTKIGAETTYWNMNLYSVHSRYKHRQLYVTLLLPDGSVRTQFKGKEAEDFLKACAKCWSSVSVKDPDVKPPPLSPQALAKKAPNFSEAVTPKHASTPAYYYWGCNCISVNIIPRRHKTCTGCGAERPIMTNLTWATVLHSGCVNPATVAQLMTKQKLLKGHI